MTIVQFIQNKNVHSNGLSTAYVPQDGKNFELGLLVYSH